MANVGYNMTTLHMACINGQADTIKVILECLRGKKTILADLIMMSGEDNMTALHLACMKGHADAVCVLYEYLQESDDILGELVLAKEEYNQTALHLACEHGHIRVVHILLDSLRNNVQILEELVLVRDEYNRTALHLAFEQGYSEVIKVIFKCLKGHQQVIKSLVLMKGKFNMTILHMACMDGQDDLIKIIFKHLKEDVLKELVMVKDCLNMSAIEVASKHTNFDCICFILHHRSNVFKTILSDYSVTSITPTISTVVIQASQRGANDTVEHILAAVYHADTLRDMSVMNEFLKVKDADGKMILQIACSRENRKMVRVILKNIDKVHPMDQKEILCHRDVMGRTALHESCQRGDNQIVQMILDAAHNAECVEKMLLSDDEETRETTALFEAFENGHYINVKNIIDHASASGCVRKLLLECKDYNQRTLFHRACQYKYDSIRCLEAVINVAKSHEETTGSLIKDLLLAQDSFGKIFTCYIAGARDDIMRLLIKTATDWEKEHIRVTDVPPASSYEGVTTDSTTELHTNETSDKTDIAKPDIAECNQLEETKLSSNVQLQGSSDVPDCAGRLTPDNNTSDLPCYTLLTSNDRTGKNPLHYAQEAHKMPIFTAFLSPFYDCQMKASKLIPTDYHLVHKEMADYGVDRVSSLLTLMGEAKCLDLIQHRYTQNYLNLCWKTYGSFFFFTNMFLYVLLLLSLATFVVSHQYNTLNYTASTDLDFTQPSEVQFIIYPLIIFSILTFMYELLQLTTKGRFYWKAKHNYTDIIVCMSCLGLSVTSLCTKYNIWHHRVGTCIMCVASINFAWMMTKIPSFSKRSLPRRIILMFTMMFRVIGRVCLFVPVFAVFIVTFAVAFHSLLQGQESFDNIGYSILKIIGMTIGELDLDAIFFSDNKSNSSPFFVLSCLLFVVFLGIVTISAMNLLVGMAVGDINELSADSEVLAFNTLVDLTLESQATVLILRKLKSYFKKTRTDLGKLKSGAVKNRISPNNS